MAASTDSSCNGLASSGSLSTNFHAPAFARYHVLRWMFKVCILGMEDAPNMQTLNVYRGTCLSQRHHHLTKPHRNLNFSVLQACYTEDIQMPHELSTVTTWLLSLLRTRPLYLLIVNGVIIAPSITRPLRDCLQEPRRSVIIAFSLPVGVLKSATDNGVLGSHAFSPASV
jgi:hypothetical protein